MFGKSKKEFEHRIYYDDSLVNYPFIAVLSNDDYPKGQLITSVRSGEEAIWLTELLNVAYSNGQKNYSNFVSGTPNKRDVYVIIGSYPNMSIQKRRVVAEDNYNCCLKMLDVNNISLHSKLDCFNTYEEANNELLKRLQKEVSQK